MREKLQQIYEFGPLSRFTRKQRITIQAADLAFYGLIRTIGSTIKFETSGWEHVESTGGSGKAPIYALWHDRIFGGTYFLRDRGIVVMTSQSLDGEYIARFLIRFGFGAVRGSSTRGAVGALVEMIRAARNSVPTAFTVDGPRGPRYEAKMGPVMLAKKTGFPILPFSVECEKYWTVNSWDQLQIPKPFSRACFMVGDPIFVPPYSDETMLSSNQKALQSSLDELVRRGKEWKNGLTP
ncbi:MAG: lysophospholipid acyltransferase family protein [Acidobacteriota bacterium]